MAALTWPVVDPKSGKTGAVTATLPPITAPSGLLFPGDPGPGRILWGQTMDATLGAINYIPTRAAQYAGDLGLSGTVYPKAFHHYIQPVPDSLQVQAANNELADLDKTLSWGGYPVIDIKETSGHSFQDVAAGSSDAMFDTLIHGIQTRNKPAGLFFHNEPAGDGLGGATDYAAAVGRLQSRIVSAGAQNLITWGGFLGIGAFTGFGGGNGDPMPWLQALAPVSKVWGTNRYLQAIDTDPPSAWKTVQATYGPFWDLQDQVDPTKARFQGEWGVHTRASDLTFATTWMDTFYTYGISRRLRCAFFFDSGVNSPKQSWLLDFQGEKSRRIQMARQLKYATSGYAA